MSALQARTPFLEDKSSEKFQPSDFARPGTLKYTVSLAPADQAIWAYAWCASNQTVLDQNMQNIKVKFVLDGKDVTSQIQPKDLPNNGQQCRLFFAALSQWPKGSHHLITTTTFANKINDGTADYPAGDYILDYTVNVQ